jgi:hypothetical protein
MNLCPLWETCPAGNCRHRQPHEAFGDCQVSAPECENCRPATDEEIEEAKCQP